MRRSMFQLISYLMAGKGRRIASDGSIGMSPHGVGGHSTMVGFVGRVSAYDHPQREAAGNGARTRVAVIMAAEPEDGLATRALRRKRGIVEAMTDPTEALADRLFRDAAGALGRSRRVAGSDLL